MYSPREVIYDKVQIVRAYQNYGGLAFGLQRCGCTALGIKRRMKSGWRGDGKVSLKRIDGESTLVVILMGGGAVLTGGLTN